MRMKNLTILGLVLIVLGVGALIFSNVSFTETKPLIKAGPLEVNTQEEHRINIPTIAGIVILLAGAGLVIAGRRSA